MKEKNNKPINTPKGASTKDGASKKVVINSIIALICLVLMYFVHWLFIIPAVYLVWINQKEIMKG